MTRVHNGQVAGRAARPAAPAEWSRMLIDPSLPGVELLHARFVRHRYAPHWHDALCVAVVTSGAAAFDCRRARHVAPSGSVFVIPPYEVHTGEPADRNGLGYRVAYLRPARLRDLLTDIGAGGRGTGWHPREIVRPRAAAARPLLRLHRTIMRPAWPLEREHALLAALITVAREFRLGKPPPDGRSWRGHRAVQLARDYLHAHPAEVITLPDLASVAGMSMYHLARTFKAETGLAPHAYQIQLRVLQAKRLLAAGRSIAETAAECGFYDQAHLTDQFKRHVGVTPGTYALGLTGPETDPAVWR
jgi:AraC-like DNA-binding protein